MPLHISTCCFECSYMLLNAMALSLVFLLVASTIPPHRGGGAKIMLPVFFFRPPLPAPPGGGNVTATSRRTQDKELPLKAYPQNQGSWCAGILDMHLGVAISCHKSRITCCLEYPLPPFGGGVALVNSYEEQKRSHMIWSKKWLPDLRGKFKICI